MLVEIKNPVVETRTVNGKNGDFNLYQLTGWAIIDPDGYPEKVIFPVNEGEKFTAGTYELLPNSFKVGAYNRLELDRAKFKQVTPPPLPSKG